MDDLNNVTCRFAIGLLLLLFPFISLNAVTTSMFGGGSGPIHYSNIICNGNETHLLNCIAFDAMSCSHDDDAGVRCPTEPECNETDIRLVDDDVWTGEIRLTNSSTAEGRVEICLNGVWGTVCDYDWGRPDAIVVCRQLNLTTDYAFAIYAHGGGSGPVHFAYVYCTGEETQLADCPVSYTGDRASARCSLYSDVGVKCPSERECEEGDIRLVNDSDGHGREFMLTGSDSSSVEEGRVEMCQNEVWGTFCDRSWGTIDAKVVCRQLNLSTDYTRALIKYEGGSGPIHYTSISCTGSETHLVNCYKRYYFSRSCLNKYAGASCPSEPECKTTAIWLVSDHVGEVDPANRGDGSTTEGRVEICINGLWGTVCDNEWDSLDTKVVCRQLNLTTHYARALYRYEGGSDPIHQAEIQCTGRETHLTNCPTGHHSYCSHSTDVGVTCPSKPECDATDIRLVSNRMEQDGVDHNSSTEGRVEICLNGVWGTVCDNGWDRFDAKVVCQQLNLTTHYAHALNHYGGGLGAIHYAYFSCTGIETQLADCPVSYTGDRASGICSHYEDAGVMCSSEPECKATDVRLVDRVGSIRLAGSGDSSVTEGRVEICINGEWGTICDNGWDSLDAKVVCRQLNLTTDYARALNHYGGGSGLIHFAGVSCLGKETQLPDCPVTYTGDRADAICSHYRDAGAMCPSEPECKATDVRLVDHVGSVRLAGSGDSSITEGRVEICINGEWGTICDNGWDSLDAKVVCRQLNLTTDHVRPLYRYSGGSGPIYSDELQCIGSETLLVNCSTGFKKACSHYNDVGVSCPSENECTETDIRLVGGVYQQEQIGVAGRDGYSISEGRVEICHNGVWGIFCDNGWDTIDVQVVCRQLNLTTDYARIFNSWYPRGSTPIHYTTVSCTGSETKLSDCRVYGTSNGVGASCYLYAGVSCAVPECDEKDIRLVSRHEGETRLAGYSNSTTEGRVEICFNGVWGTVCDYGWGRPDAIVVCRQLNLSTHYARALSQYGGGSGSIHYAFMYCTGSETQLADCYASYTGDSASRWCTHYEDAGVSCPVSECDETHIRLVSRHEGEMGLADSGNHSNSTQEGRVEICLNGVWGTVCDEGWDTLDAKVVCQQLNLTTDYAHALSHYGGGSGPIHFAGIFCNGNETQLADCPVLRTGDTDRPNVCGSHYNVAGVRCPSEPECDETDIRLRDGRTTDEGRVEVCLNGHWGSVCLDGWDVTDAAVVCRQLGYGGISFTLQNYESNNTSNFNLDDVHCTGHESKLSECDHRGIGIHDCREGFDEAGVACTGPFSSSKPEGTTFSSSTTSYTVSMSSSTPTSLSTFYSTSSEGKISGIIVGIMGFIVATIVVPVVVVLVVMYKKRRRRKQLERVQMDILATPGHGQSTGNYDESHIYEAATGNSRESELQDKQLTSISDPNPYSANTLLGSSSYAHETRIRVPSHYLRELTCGKFVIKHEDITLLDSIGEGEFGIVYKARLSCHGRRHREVAIKTLKGDFDQLDIDKFVEESLKMGRFKHSHVMGLIGVCLDAGSAPFIIMPYMANGSLLKYLKKERDTIVILGQEDEDDVKAVSKRLTVMCSQIASGMEYLAAEKYIHRDLAARNCMIDTHFLIKITDFGLAEDVFVRNYFRQGSAEEVVKLPVKWMAPESLSDGHFSEKSDVWSYGVTMWEVFSGGKAPYPGTNPLTLIKQLEEGERMPKPYNTACSDEMYAMMQKCWEKSPKDRPTFKELHLNLNQYIEHIAGYLEMGFNPFATEEVPTNEEGEEKDGVAEGSAEAKTTG